MEDYLRILFCITITFSLAIVNTIIIIDALLNKEDLFEIIVSIIITLLTIYYFISALVGMIRKRKIVNDKFIKDK